MKLKFVVAFLVTFLGLGLSSARASLSGGGLEELKSQMENTIGSVAVFKNALSSEDSVSALSWSLESVLAKVKAKADQETGNIGLELFFNNSEIKIEGSKKLNWAHTWVDGAATVVVPHFYVALELLPDPKAQQPLVRVQNLLFDQMKFEKLLTGIGGEALKPSYYLFGGAPDWLSAEIEKNLDLHLKELIAMGLGERIDGYLTDGLARAFEQLRQGSPIKPAPQGGTGAGAEFPASIERPESFQLN